MFCKLYKLFGTAERRIFSFEALCDDSFSQSVVIIRDCVGFLDSCPVVVCVLLGSRYSGVFPSLNMAVKRREQTLQDYKRLQSKVEKYEEKEKTGPVMVKLHQVLQISFQAGAVHVHVPVHSSAPSASTEGQGSCALTCCAYCE